MVQPPIMSDLAKHSLPHPVGVAGLDPIVYVLESRDNHQHSQSKVLWGDKVMGDDVPNSTLDRSRESHTLAENCHSPEFSNVIRPVFIRDADFSGPTLSCCSCLALASLSWCDEGLTWSC